MGRRRLFLNILMMPVCFLLVCLAIHKYHDNTVRSERKHTAKLNEPTGSGDASREQSGTETVFMSSQDSNSESFPGGPTHLGHGHGQSKKLAKLSRDGGQSKGRTNEAVAGKLSSLPAYATGAFSRAGRGAATSSITDGGPDKLSSPYIRSYNESIMCRVRRDSSKHNLQLTVNTKLILYWQELDNYWERLGGFRQMCPFPTDGPCEVTWDESYQPRADAVVFHASRLVREDLPFRKLPGQVWVARALESPIHWNKNYRSPSWKGVFNWTFTYRPDSELFSPVGTLVKVPGRHKVDYRQIARSKKRSVAWFVSDCITDSKRENYVKELEKYIDVDIYGECGNLKCPKNNKKDCFDLLSETYRFYLAFENSLCNHYITEKFFNKFGRLGQPQYIIPVVRGGTNYRKYFPEGTFIDAADFNSPKALASYLNKFRTDIDAYAALLAKKDQFATVSCFRSVAWCKLCNMLHDKNIKPKVYKDLGAWWDEQTCVEPKDI